MAAMLHGSAKKQGLPPGTPVYTGTMGDGTTAIHLVDYGPDHHVERDDLTPEACAAYRGADSVTWIDVVGLSDVALLHELCTLFDVHPLAIEDVVQVAGRPKAEDYGTSVLIVVKAVHNEIVGTRFDVEMEHVSLILGPNYVITLQEAPGDPFDTVRRRLRDGLGLLGQRGADYLAYALLDSLVDSWFPVVDGLGRLVEDMEEELLADPWSRHQEDAAPTRISDLRTANISLLRTLRSMREAIRSMAHIETALIDADATDPYLRDLHDHTCLLIDGADLYREMIMGLVDLHSTRMNNRLNDTMKVLTVISMIFMPLTLLTGLYGMNFKYMPETQWAGSYYVVLGAMALIAAGLTAFFKYRRWF